MLNPDTDQATRVRQLRNLLASIRRLEMYPRGQEDLERADVLRQEAEEVGKPLPPELVNQLLREYSGGNLMH